MRSRVALFMLIATGAVAAPEAAVAAPGDLHLASANAAGVGSNASSLVASVSADGTLVAFFSDATNLHPGDTDPGADVYVKNVRTGELILASRAPEGAKGNGDSRVPVISADGTRVAFLSEATNLHPARVPGVYVKDLRTGAVLLASTTAAGVPANAGAAAVALSADGTRVAFSTMATNLHPKDPVDDFDVYVKDLVTGQLTLASLSAADEKRFGLFGSLGATLSADGRRVGFHSDAAGLHPSDPDGAPDVFVRDLVSGELLLVSTNDAGVKGNGQSTGPSLSSDGRKVALTSYATNFDPRVITNGSASIYLKDLVTGDLSLVSTNAAGDVIRGGISNPSMSADATRIAFDAASTNAHPADADGVADVYVKDLLTGHVFLGSTASSGVKGNGASYSVFLAAGGGTVAFRSDATNLAATDTDSVPDIYAKELGDAPQAPGDRANLAVTQTDSPDPVPAGQRLAYDIRVRNAGPATATGVTVLEELDASVRFESALVSRGACGHAAGVVRCDLGTLPAGATATVTVLVRPDQQGTIAARASVQAIEPDADSSDNASRVLTRVEPAADLSIALTDTPDPVRVRDRLTYRAEVFNTGPSTAGTATVSVHLPDAVRLVFVTAPAAFCPSSSADVTCSFFGVEPGERVTVTIAVVPKRAGALTASATVSSPDTTDPAAGNNSDGETTTVVR